MAKGTKWGNQDLLDVKSVEKTKQVQSWGKSRKPKKG